VIKFSIHVIQATRVPAAVVFRRGPSQWWHIARWHLDTGEVEGGAWFRGALYPRRCDLSPDGKLLYYFALKGTRREFLGMTGVQTYSAVSKAPWLFALAAWRELGTWTRGYHFIEGSPEEGQIEIGRPDAGDAGPLGGRYRLACTGVLQYEAERRRGWVEHEACPPRKPSDAWDERRSVILTRPSPAGRGRLVLTDQGWSTEGPGRIEGRSAVYRIEEGRRSTELPEAAWASFDQVGRLLVATRQGQLQIRDAGSGKVVREASVGELKPSPRAAPDWAQRWIA
jgi:hypothetical protein